MRLDAGPAQRQVTTLGQVDPHASHKIKVARTAAPSGIETCRKFRVHGRVRR
ncbi:hypothetical protein FAGKG844_50106 [Frankia sp. AgKG'84/4]